MSLISSAQAAPVQPPSAEPFVPNPSESAMLWLVIGIAALFVGYLIVDAIIQRTRRRRMEREQKERTRQAAQEMAEAQEAARLLNERNATELPPPR